MKDQKMSDAIVILGTLAILGIVAVTTVSLVYNRSLGLRGNKESIEINTRATNARSGVTQSSAANTQKPQVIEED